jgi:hypothetical protein
MVVPISAPEDAPPSHGFRLAPEEPRFVTQPQEAASATAVRSDDRLKLSKIEQPSDSAGIPEELLADRVPIPLDKDFEPAPLAVSPHTSPTVMTIKSGWRHTVRTVLKNLSWMEEWAYVISIIFLMISVTGMLFEYRPLGYGGAVGVVLSSVILLALGGFEVFVKPFKESPFHGLAFLFLFPPTYMIYYAATRWKAMNRPVRHALGSFVPLAVLILAFVFIRPIRNYFLHSPPKKKDGLEPTASAPVDPGPPIGMASR